MKSKTIFLANSIYVNKPKVALIAQNNYNSFDRVQIFKLENKDQIQAWPFTFCGTKDKLLNFSEPQLPHL